MATILVADDDAGVRSIVARLLTAWGYEVITAVDGADAVAVAASYRAPIALLLTDVQMPGYDGVTLATYLKVAQPDLRVLFMSGASIESLAREGYHPPAAAAFLHKPVEITELQAAVAEALSCSGRDSGAI